VADLKQGITDWSGVLFEDDRPPVFAQPLLHALRERRDRHRIPAPLIIGQLAVHLCEQEGVIEGCAAECHCHEPRDTRRCQKFAGMHWKLWHLATVLACLGTAESRSADPQNAETPANRTA
jgi:hypothetical protein